MDLFKSTFKERDFWMRLFLKHCYLTLLEVKLHGVPEMDIDLLISFSELNWGGNALSNMSNLSFQMRSLIFPPPKKIQDICTGSDVGTTAAVMGFRKGAFRVTVECLCISTHVSSQQLPSDYHHYCCQLCSASLRSGTDLTYWGRDNAREGEGEEEESQDNG